MTEFHARTYAWQDRSGGRVHLLDAHGKTLCRLENTGAEFPVTSSLFPVDLMGEPIKPFCQNCNVLEISEPSLRVLMGEAMD